MSAPFWLRDPYRPRPPLDGPVTCDVVIVGGGITGTAAAWWLASRDCSVALLERGDIASGASGRNAGFLLAGTHHAYSIAVKAHGPERARRLQRLSLENHRLTRTLIGSESIDCGYARNGSYTLALSENEFRAHRRSAEALERDGFRIELLDDTDAAALFPRAGFRGGLHHPEDGEVDPVRLVRGVAAAAERRGARIFERTPVTGIENESVHVTVSTPGGRVSAPMLLLATNAWTGGLHPYFEDPMVSMRAQMLATEPCPERLVPAPVYADFGFEYFRQLPDGRLLAGGGRRAGGDRELTLHEAPSDAVQEAIESFLRSCLPGAEGLKITHRWAGLMGFSCDELPNVGPVPGAVNTYVAAGFHGHGLGFAVICAKAAAEMMLDGRTSEDVSLFSPRRHLPG